MLGLGLRDRLENSRVHRLYRWSVSPEYRRASRTAREILGSVPGKQLEAIRSRYLVDDPGAPGSRIVHTSSRKYLDSQFWLENAVERALAAGLDTKPGRSVLDLGCGAGYFLLAARHFGHRVMGLDLDENRMYNELITLFGLERVAHCIEPMQSLPDLGRQFDLITGYMVYFNFYNFGVGDARAWGPQEWGFFLDNVRPLLTPGGRLHLQLNKGGPYLRPEERGVYLTDTTVTHLERVPGVRISEGRSVLTLDQVSH